jgi:phosphoesterase RecJ-like protein
MKNINQAVAAIRKAKSIVIASHRDPDGDTLGSLLALGLGLRRIGKKVYMVSVDGVPRRYERLPGAGKIVKTTNKKCDLAVAIDCDDREVLGKAFKIFQKAKQILDIDHHEFRTPFGDINLVDYRAAAVGEIIYNILNKLKIRITTDIAQNILTSIIVETNSFLLPETSAATFKICSELMQKGINFHKLTEMIYWSKTKEEVLLSGICLERCKFLERGKIAWSMITKKDFDRVGGKDEDVDAVADDIRAIKTAKIVLVFREKSKDILRVSLRSKGKYNVANLAAKYGGGGHFDVAGCRVPNTKKTVNRMLTDAKKLLKGKKI